MKKRLTRRIFLKTALGTLLTVIGLGSGGFVYAHNIEPSLLDIQFVEMKHNLIPKSFDGLKIVQFSDTHLGFQYSLKQLSGLIKKINSFHPDLVFFTGDLMDAPNQFKETDKIIPILQQINAPLGKYSIYGNHDHGGYGSTIYKNIMQTANFTLLQNESKQIQLSDGSRIYLIGIDDAMLGRPDFNIAQQQVPENAFKILLSHAPDLVERASQYNIPWQLSGHSHGGQVKIPFVGALVIPPFAQKYPEGYYLVKNTNLYVNRGLGTTRLPFRFMAKPELTVFTLKSV